MQRIKEYKLFQIDSLQGGGLPKLENEVMTLYVQFSLVAMRYGIHGYSIISVLWLTNQMYP